jgi:hypothetical protein
MGSECHLMSELPARSKFAVQATVGSRDGGCGTASEMASVLEVWARDKGPKEAGGERRSWPKQWIQCRKRMKERFKHDG